MSKQKTISLIIMVSTAIIILLCIYFYMQGKSKGKIHMFELMEFDGTEDFVNVDVPNSQDFTFAAWVYWNGGDKGQRIFEAGVDNDNCMYFSPYEGIDPKTGVAHFYILKDGVGHMLTAPQPLPQKEWVHVAVTIKDNVGKLYINGDLKSSYQDMILTPSSIEIKKSYLGKGIDYRTRNFNGKLDKVVITDMALSIDEIVELSESLNIEEQFDDSMLISNLQNSNIKNSKLVDGFMSKSILLDGTGYIEIAPEDTYERDITFYGQFLIQESEKEQALFCYGNENEYFGVSVDPQGKLTFYLEDADTAKHFSSKESVQFKNWTSISVVIQGNTVNIYTDGEVIASNLNCDLSFIKGLDEASWKIGQNSWSQNLSGIVDDIRIYESALSEDKLAKLTVAPIAKFTFDGHLGNNLYDGEQIIAEGQIEFDIGYNQQSKSMLFDSDEEYISIPHSMFNNANLSISVWIKSNSETNIQNIIELQNKQASSYLKVSVDPQQENLKLIASNDGVLTSVSSESIETNRWIHVALVIHNNDCKLYLDGKLAIEKDELIAENFTHTVRNVFLGNGFDGNITDLQIYGNSISNETICKIMRDKIVFPSEDLNLEYIKSGDITMSGNYAYWGYAQEHDGEIVKDEESGYYYIYSTDTSPGNKTQPGASLRPAIQIRRSKDIIHWEFYGWVWDAVPNEAELWTGTDSMLWAPSVGYFGGKWHLYYSVSSLGQRQSFIGVATSDSPAGPWVDEGEVFKTLNNDKQYEVNPIDPNLFIDKDGTPWLLYGSYYGGIYINELDPNTGKLVNYGEGTCIARRRNNIDVTEKDSIEGAFLVYHEESKKYVLFASYDHFYGNYNVRVGRADTPDGIYLDYNGNALTDVNKQQIQQVGTKILGSYQFNGDPGWWGLGHNAVYEEDGEWLSINNSHCFEDPSFCYMHIRKLIWTDDGWPVLSPERYAKETEQEIPKMSLVGQWERIKFRQESNELLQSKKLMINADGTLGKNKENYWEFKSPNTLILHWYYENLSDNYLTEEVKILPAWDWENWKPTLVFTGLDENGVMVWGKNID